MVLGYIGCIGIVQVFKESWLFFQKDTYSIKDNRGKIETIIRTIPQLWVETKVVSYVYLAEENLLFTCQKEMLPGKHHCRWTVEENEKIKGLTSNRKNARARCSFIFIVGIIPSVTQDNKCVAFFGCVFTQTSTHCLMEQMTAVSGSSANRPGPAHSVCCYTIKVHKKDQRLPSVLPRCFPQQTALWMPGKQWIPPPKQRSFCRAVLRSAPSDSLLLPCSDAGLP